MSTGTNMTEADEYATLQSLLLRRFTEALQGPEPRASMLAAAARFLSEARAQGQIPPTIPPIDTSRLPFRAPADATGPASEGTEKAATVKAKPADAKPAKSLADIARGLPFATVTSGAE